METQEDIKSITPEDIKIIYCDREASLEDTIDGMLSDNYVDRFIAEYMQTDIRLRKLSDIIMKMEAKEDLEFTPTCSLDLLHWQLNVMLDYLYVLEHRAVKEGIELPTD